MYTCAIGLISSACARAIDMSEHVCVCTPVVGQK